MIREITKEEIKESVRVITESFMTVADELGFTAENAPRFTAFATTEDRLMYQMEVEKRPMYGFFSDEGSGDGSGDNAGSGSGKMLGYYSLAKQSDTEWELNNLCVLPDHRHDGIGDLLLQDAFKRARELGAANRKASCISAQRSSISSRSPADIWKKHYNAITFQVAALCGHFFFPKIIIRKRI